MSWTSLFASIHSSDRIFTGIGDRGGDSSPWIGRIHQSPKLFSAHIHYLLKPEKGAADELIALLELLIVEAGRWGANQVVAEIEPDSDTFLQFRQAGFSVLAKHHIYKFDLPPAYQPRLRKRWRIWNSEDIHKMRSLYFTIVPPLIQPVEPLSRREMLGLVYYDESGELQAYADLVYGPAGAWVLPIIHPQATENIADLITQLIFDLPDLAGRSAYITVRSYQPWIESAVKNLSGHASAEQALMVRYLAIRQRAHAELKFQALENGKPEPTFPLTPIERHQD